VRAIEKWFCCCQVKIGLIASVHTDVDIYISLSHNVYMRWFFRQMVLQFACSKAGFVLYSLDPAVAVTNPEKSKEGLQRALELTEANILVSQEAGSDVNYIRLAEAVVPELRIFDFSTGMPFITPRFPHLRLCLHTGFEQEDKWGWLLLKHMIVPSNNLDQFVPQPITGTTPLAGSLVLDKDGVPTGLGATLTNDQVVKQNIWPTYSKILKREYHTVEGVGVVF
jgi:hypothetical protein